MRPDLTTMLLTLSGKEGLCMEGELKKGSKEGRKGVRGMQNEKARPPCVNETECGF